MHKIHRYRWPNHPMGTCFIRQSDQLVYVNIPKNATEYTKLLFDGTLTNFYENAIPEDYRYLIVLRNPIERWYSGLCEYVQRYTTINPDSDVFDQFDALKILTTACANDEHTELQLRFIAGLPSKNAVFFNFNDNFTTNLTDWFDQNNVAYPQSLSGKKRNVTEKEWITLRNRIKKHVESNTELLESLNEYLKLDIKLYNSVQYYIKGEK